MFTGNDAVLPFPCGALEIGEKSKSDSSTGCDIASRFRII